MTKASAEKTINNSLNASQNADALSTLATTINSALTKLGDEYHDDFYPQMAVIGHALLSAKETLPYGMFTAWIRENCSCSLSAARNYMYFVKRFWHE